MEKEESNEVDSGNFREIITLLKKHLMEISDKQSNLV